MRPPMRLAVRMGDGREGEKVQNLTCAKSRRGLGAGRGSGGGVFHSFGCCWWWNKWRANVITRRQDRQLFFLSQTKNWKEEGSPPPPASPQIFLSRSSLSPLLFKVSKHWRRKMWGAFLFSYVESFFTLLPPKKILRSDSNQTPGSGRSIVS